jgi:hypothetical protein
MIIFASVCLLVLAAVHVVSSKTYRDQRAIDSFTHDIRAALTSNVPITDMIARYSHLLDQVGAEKAQEALMAAVPEGGVKVHLINHQSGKFLYRTKGPAGIAGCKPYIVGSCYHGFMIAMTADRGLSIIPELVATCKKHLEHQNTRDCAHGVGHTLLIDAGYDNLSKALASCRTYFHDDAADLGFCYTGVFMQNSFGTTSEAGQSGHLFERNDPMYPCNTPEVARDRLAHRRCWIIQSLTLLSREVYPRIGGDIKKAGAYCESLTDTQDRTICFRSIGAQIEVRSNDDLPTMRARCMLLGHGQEKQCVWYGAVYAYQYGNNLIPQEACGSEHDQGDRATCYQKIYKAITLRYSGLSERVTACNDATTAAYRTACITWMNDPNVDAPVSSSTSN